jgi:hypothetical protein
MTGSASKESGSQGEVFSALVDKSMGAAGARR